MALADNDAARDFLEQLRRREPRRYAEELALFRAKRTQLEMVLARGYGDPAPAGDAPLLEPDFEWLYLDLRDGTKIGCDPEWEEEVFPRFYSFYQRRLRRLSDEIAALRPAEDRAKLTFFDALSNVYYSARRDCYLYVRFVGKDTEVYEAIREQRDSQPISRPGLPGEAAASARPRPRLCHAIYIFPESERGRRVLDMLQPAEDAALPAPSVFFLQDLVANPTVHYLNPDFELLPGGPDCVHTERGRRGEGALPDAAAPRREGGEAAAALAAARVAKSDLALLHPQDPVALYLGAVSGDVVALTNFPRYNTFVPIVRTLRRVGLR